MDINPQIFKSYDIRGVYPTDFNEEIARAIVKAFITIWKPKKVVLSRDVRNSGESLFIAALEEFLDCGVNVLDIGVVSTDMFYFAVGETGLDGGITISASHNPSEWNGMNFCKKGAVPISGDTGLMQIKEIVEKGTYDVQKGIRGAVEKKDILDDFLKKSASFIDTTKIKPLKIVANANFGVDFKIVSRAKELFNLPIELIPLNEKPDGSFPKGPPNPLLPENREEFVNLVKESKADFGVSWDADGDRVFFADENGEFIEGYFTTAVLAKELLKKEPGGKVLIDPRLVWATTEEITNSGGKAIVSKPGMTLIAARMKEEDAIFGGEMSSHFYFRENFYRDNGIIPLFLIMEMISTQNTTLSQLVKPYVSKYFTPGELNFETEKKDEIIKAAEEKYKDGKIEHIDGLSVEFEQWRFNLRKSNTEPLLRLNLEAKSKELMEQKRDELIELIKGMS